jgi:uncharacterized protein (DUF2147 family)
MRKLAFSGMFFLSAAAIAQAAEPLGEWRDQDGLATIKIVDCDSRLWGVVASEKNPGGIDKSNPDKTKRSRPTLGIPVLINLKKVADEKDKWEGQIYDATSGKTYDSSIQLKSANSLRVEGCVVWPLCGGQTWTRVEPGTSGFNYGPAGAPKAPVVPKAAAPTQAPVAVTPPKAAVPKATAAKAGSETAVSEVCLLPEIASAPK